MNRRSFLCSTVGVGTAGLAGCVIDRDDWDAIESWIEDTFELVDAVGVALEAWAEDPESVPTSEFEELADRTTDHLDRFRDDIEPIKDDIIEETVGPEDDIDGNRLWDILEDLEWLVQAAKTGTEGVADADGDELETPEADAVDTVIDDREEILEEAEPIVEEA